MISSQKPVEITEYLPVDRMAEGICYVKPKEGEKFILYPWSWFEDHSYPFIEVQKDNKVIATINASEVAEVHFV